MTTEQRYGHALENIALICSGETWVGDMSNPTTFDEGRLTLDAKEVIQDQVTRALKQGKRMSGVETIPDNATDLLEEMDAYHNFTKGEFDLWGNPTVEPDPFRAEETRKRGLKLARVVVRDLVANKLNKQNKSC